MLIDCRIVAIAESKTLVVLPALNEEAAIADVIAKVRQELPKATCLVVDDGSSDQTAQVAASAGAIVVRLPFNLGVGGAMRLGFRFALERGFHAVVQVDADGQHDPADTHVLLQSLETADVVIGARFAGSGGYRTKGPRRWAMAVLAFVMSHLAATRLTDTTSGFRASNDRAIRLFAEHYPAEYLGDTVESLVIAARAGLRIRQEPVAMKTRQGGVPSHNPLRAALYLGRACLALVFAIGRSPLTVPSESSRSGS